MGAALFNCNKGVMGMELSRFIADLRDYCRDHVLEEKWLLAPSVRAGFQWADQVARSGQPVLNLRVKTFLQLAMALAAPEMELKGLRLLRGAAGEAIVGGAFTRLSEKGHGYLSALEPGAGLIRTIHRAIRDLRVAGVTAAEIQETRFEVPAKGREIKALLADYEQELSSRKLLDDAGILHAAAERLRKSLCSLPAGTVLLSAEDERELSGLQRALWEAIPAACRVVLAVDQPGAESDAGSRGSPGIREERTDAAPSQPVVEPGSASGISRKEWTGTDAALLAWVLNPTAAPVPRKDGSAEIFRAVGESNEVREILRRCVEQGISFDLVEILHTDRDTYVPLVYELARTMEPEDSKPIPVTFSEGIPPRYSKPAKALMGWLTWIRGGYPQSVLARMIQDGLFEIKDAGDDGPGFTKTAALLRRLPVGSGRDRYLEVMDQELRALEAKAAEPCGDLGGDEGQLGYEPGEEGALQARSQYYAGRLQMLKALRSLAADLLEWSGTAAVRAEEETAGVRLLTGALLLLERRARRVSELDQYAWTKLCEEIRGLIDCLNDEEIPGLDAAVWLSELTRSSPVLGSGPRAGCLHVSHVDSGGHSGRPYTFVLGLDDTRFPGLGLQDPLLLDRERVRISGDLPTAAGRLAARLGRFAGLLARLRGKVTLSYCCRNLVEDREMFPSPVVLSAYRLLSDNRQGDAHALVRWLPEPASFAPRLPGRCTGPTEWWLWRMCGAEEKVTEAEACVRRHFAHLERGFRAREARQSDRFTEYDGYVPQASVDLDPCRPDGQPVSASRLEKLGACPMEYFLCYVLGVKPPEDFEFDPGAWLDALQRGQLLHRVFRQFMAGLNRDGRLPQFSRDRRVLERILEQEIGLWQRQIPPPNAEVFRLEKLDLVQTARIFLLEEEDHCQGVKPRFFEVSVGMTPEGEGTLLDSEEPVAVKLPGGKVVRARGRIDRMDEMPRSGDRSAFMVWDYKTGSAWKYRTKQGKRRDDPFDQGRLVQGILYLEMAESRLREQVSSRARVEQFGYFFPSVREHGERISWRAEDLVRGKQVLEDLCRLMAAGCFPFTDDPEDVSLSDYMGAFGVVEQAALQIRAKLENSKNVALEPMRRLRGYITPAD